MKILVVGSGGREHALGIKLSASRHRPRLLFAPGNPGMEALGECAPVAAHDADGLVALARREEVDWTLVGPEAPLVAGIADRFATEGLRLFGPTAAAARLEGSKAFAKSFMARYGIPTAAFESFRELDAARRYVKKQGAPIVVKASGLAAGKGAVVCEREDQAVETLESMLGPQAVFGEAGREVVIEERLRGEEVSVFAVCDGKGYALLPTAQDHKPVYDGDKGPNTGGMGAYAPAAILSASQLGQVREAILEPTLAGMAREGALYTGFLYLGLMLTDAGPKVIEYNCRLGDPEAQVVLPVYAGDLVDLLEAALDGRVDGAAPAAWKGCAAVVVMTSQGYPGPYAKGRNIGLQALPEGAHLIHAGTARQGGELKTAGGRVLGLVGTGANLETALGRSYAAVERVSFEGAHWRRDIGKKGLPARVILAASGPEV